MAALNDVGVVLGQEVHSRNGYRLVDIRKGGLAMCVPAVTLHSFACASVTAACPCGRLCCTLKPLQDMTAFCQLCDQLVSPQVLCAQVGHANSC